MANTPQPIWTLVTSHGVVLFYVSTHPEVTLREMSLELELTERRVSTILKDLKEAGLLEVSRQGRRNLYRLRKGAKFRHPFLSYIPVEDFLAFMRRLAPLVSQ